MGVESLLAMLHATRPQVERLGCAIAWTGIDELPNGMDFYSRLRLAIRLVAPSVNALCLISALSRRSPESRARAAPVANFKRLPLERNWM